MVAAIGQRAQGGRAAVGRLFRRGDVEAAHHGDLSQHRRMGAGHLRHRGRGAPPFRRFGQAIVATAGGAARRQPAQSDRAQSGEARAGIAATRELDRAAGQQVGRLCGMLGLGRSVAGSKKFAATLAKTAQGVYRHPTFSDYGLDAALSRGLPGHFDHVVEHIHGRSKKKNLSVEARHAPLGRRPQGPDLCRGQEFRRNAPPAPHRPEDRHVSRPPGSGAEGKLRSFHGLRLSKDRPLAGLFVFGAGPA
ncbi:hypothetical protein MPL3365_10022 [Mesorhizobium plurifarium]|uniref:Uncharacterized protein n=1 Tax=Mesorhizobium plurifarium TaxID=69974 RepID=A0A090FSV3_MESPL|nr:hypothetical protein MPL3365_10022 [Mesorhizobium plurifarium]